MRKETEFDPRQEQRGWPSKGYGESHYAGLSESERAKRRRYDQAARAQLAGNVVHSMVEPAEDEALEAGPSTQLRPDSPPALYKAARLRRVQQRESHDAERRQLVSQAVLGNHAVHVAQSVDAA